MATVKGGIKTGTRILACPGCKPHPYQDETYKNPDHPGRPYRVHNGCSGGYRCTICSDKKTVD